MRSVAVSAAVAAALLAGLASSASAQTVLNRWNFNGTTTATFRTPSSGSVLSGTIGGFGTSSTPSAPLSTQIVSGAASDPGTLITNTTAPVGTWTYNRSVNMPSPSLPVSNTSTGVTFLSPTTGYAGQNIKLSWSQTVGFRGSRYFQLLVSTSGTAGPFSVPSGGTGSSISQFVTGLNSGTSTISGTATVSVSSSGLIDFRTIDGNWVSQVTGTAGTPANYANGFVDNISYTLPTGQGFENNANFAFAISTVWDPIGTYTSGTTGLLSSFAGTNSTDVINGYITSASSGGSMRLDLVTVTAVPEPTTSLMLGTSAIIGGSLAWRRRRRGEAV
ncbi:MAG: PEP-CTERM sorting domain-containing protein [Planctomycetes bacterium]|nr:PEP-CTERM sorting domain-containing protein [Planctomycetota bacterium]